MTFRIHWIIKIAPGQCDPITYVKNGNINNISLRPVSNDEVMSILRDMRISRPGWDDLSLKIVKQTYMNFSTVVSYM